MLFSFCRRLDGPRGSARLLDTWSERGSGCGLTCTAAGESHAVGTKFEVGGSS